MLVVFTTDGSGARNEWRKSCTVGGHGVPDRGVEKEFSGIKCVRGNHIQDALCHLAVFPRAKASRNLVSGISRLSKFGDDDFQAGVITSFSAEESEKVCYGLMNAVNAAPFLAHEKVIRTPGEIGVADGDDACIIPGSC